MDVLQWDAVGLEVEHIPEETGNKETFYVDRQILFWSHGNAQLSIHELLPRRSQTVS